MLITLSKNDREQTKVLLKHVAKQSGSQRKLAKFLHVTESTISQLIKGTFLPSPRMCVLIEHKYGIKKEELRPDIFMLN